jgi:DNA-binding MarR family transcriptional regulator
VGLDTPAFDETFDEAFLSQVRLGIVAVLLVRKEATFTEVKDLLGVTQGNLGMHLQRLEDAGYVAVEKTFVGRKPRTTCRLTRAGRDAFLRHVRRLEGLAACAPTAGRRPPPKAQ